jgi:hypothetical protein
MSEHNRLQLCANDFLSTFHVIQLLCELISIDFGPLSLSLKPRVRICECDEVGNFASSVAENSQINTTMQSSMLAFAELCQRVFGLPGVSTLAITISTHVMFKGVHGPGRSCTLSLVCKTAFVLEFHLCTGKEHLSEQKYVLIQLPLLQC